MEQRLIDANNINVEDTIGGRNEFADCIRDSVDCVLSNAPTVLTIPENPTNGDMIKALFDTKIKDIEIYLTKMYVFIHFKDGNSMRVWKDWWNAPYKRGEENEVSD